MKKTLAALAVLGAFAGSALAAEVQLYGILDTGVGQTLMFPDITPAPYSGIQWIPCRGGWSVHPSACNG